MDADAATHHILNLDSAFGRVLQILHYTKQDNNFF